jgi:hypothetical protein
MQRVTGSIISILLTLGSFAMRAAGDTKAAEVLAQARAALGGERRLSQVQALSAAGSYQREVGDRRVNGELTIDLQLPDKMLRTESMNPIGDATVIVLQGINGERVIRHSRTIGGGPGMVIRMAAPAAGSDAEAQALRNQRAELARIVVAFLLTSPPALPVEFSYAGETEADEGKADVIDAKGAGSFGSRLFLDKQTHRPLMLQYRGAAPRLMMQTRQMGRGGVRGGQPDSERPERLPMPDAPQIVDITMFLDDYRAVEGVLLPHRISRSIDGTPNEEWTFRTIKLNPTFKPDAFAGK